MLLKKLNEIASKSTRWKHFLAVGRKDQDFHGLFCFPCLYSPTHLHPSPSAVSKSTQLSVLNSNIIVSRKSFLILPEKYESLPPLGSLKSESTSILITAISLGPRVILNTQYIGNWWMDEWMVIKWIVIFPLLIFHCA